MILIVKSRSGLPRPVAFFTLIASLACALALAGCGQQGPLYMPDQPLDSHGKPIKRAKGAGAGPNAKPAADTGYVPPDTNYVPPVSE